MDVLHGINMHVKEKAITEIIGPNGAGKSTLFKTVFGLLRPSKGHIYFKEEEITGLKPIEIIKKGIGYVAQGKSLFPHMTVLENLEMSAFLKKDIKKELDFVYSYFPVLKEREREKVRNLSGGQQQMVVIAGALMMDPQLILLDEPSISLSPKLVEEVFHHIHTFNEREGRTFAIIEQNVGVIFDNCDYIYVIELGKNALEGTAEDLLKDQKIQDLYLGARQR